MTVRTTLKTISEPDKDIVQFADDFARLSKKIGQRAFKKIEIPLLDELRFYPPERPNQRYVRTYRLQRGWKAGIVQLGVNSFGLVVSNDTDYTAFVVGSLAQAISAAARFQADVHRNRWQLATETVKFWFEAYLEELNKEFESELAQFGTIRNSQRAFTRRTR